MARHHRLSALALALFLLIGRPASSQPELTEEELGHWIGYILDLERRVSRNGGDAQLMLRLADAYIQVGDLRRAIPALDQLADLRLDPVRIALLRGDAYFQIADYDQAARAYLEVLSRAPGQGHAMGQLWRLMLRVTLTGAESGFDRAAVLETLQNRGLYFPDSYRPSERGPEDAARQVDRANSLLLRQRPSEAIALLTRAIALDPANADAFAALARAYQAENEPEAALGASLVYLILAPDAPDASRVRHFIGRELERTHLR